jgi:hypothetical protein
MSFPARMRSSRSWGRAIAWVEPIRAPKAMEEHMALEVPREGGGEQPSNGLMSVHDWWGMEIVVNMKGL